MEYLKLLFVRNYLNYYMKLSFKNYLLNNLQHKINQNTNHFVIKVIKQMDPENN